MVSRKRIRPRSLEAYSEDVRQKARAAFIAFSFIERMSPERAAPYIENVNNGDYDDLPMIQMAAFILSGKHAV